MPNPSAVARRFLPALLLSCLFAVPPPASADDFLVNHGGWSVDIAPGDGTCADAGGQCTLHAAIMEGNFRAGSHTITFSVPMVTLGGNLQQLRAPFTITGALPARTIINGNGFDCFSLTDSGDIPTGHFDTGANGSILQNLVIQNCSSHGISGNGHGWQFLNNFIGTDPTGTAVVPFGQPGATGNDGDGISISSSRVYTNQTNELLQDLFAAIPAQPLDSAQINNFATQLDTLGANFLLGPVHIFLNVISGNEGNGIEIFSQNLAFVLVQGNRIGTDVTGNVALGNGGSGVRFVGSPWMNMIGPGNVISGNAVHGIDNDAGNVALPNFVMGNRIGIAATDPTSGIGNGLSGIYVDSKPETSLDGYVNPSGQAFVIGPFNVVSDNKGENNNAFPDEVGASVNAGIIVTGASGGVKVLGNVIGLGEFPPGTPVSSQAYGNAGDGVIVTVSGIQIGGTGAVDGNVIAANARHGLLIKGSNTNETKVVGNSIGVHPALANDLTLGNGVDGIHSNAAGTATIGGTGSTDFNTVAANGRNGVRIVGGGYQNGWGNLLQRNRIFGNAVSGTGIGIDLDRVANDYNPTDSEIPANYANLNQVAPVICAGAPGEPAACAGAGDPAEVGGTTTFEWTLTTHGPGPIDTEYRVEIFQIDGAEPNGSTSMTFLGERTVTADTSGVLQCPNERCVASVGASTAGSSVVMTVTDVTQVPAGPNTGWLELVQCLTISDCFVHNTSELSNAATSTAAFRRAMRTRSTPPAPPPQRPRSPASARTTPSSVIR
jgi:trimeric autotransporter adhesin